MPTEHESLTEALHTLAIERSGQDTFDAPSFLERAHRARIRRRTLRMAATAVFVTIACLVGTLLIGHPGPSQPVAPSPAPGVTGTGADPLVLDQTFGWLPPSLDRLSYQVSATPATANFYTSPNSVYASSEDPQQPARVDAFVAAGPPPYKLQGLRDAGPVGLIDGKPVQAQMGTDETGRKTMVLRFQSPRGELTTVMTHGLSLYDTDKIARSVVFERKALPLPIRVTGIDAPADRAGVIFDTIRGVWSDAYLDLAVKAGHNYEAVILAFPAGHPPTQDHMADDWLGKNASEDHDGVHVIVGLSDTVTAPYTATWAHLFPEKTVSSTSVFSMDPTDYGDPAAFLASHVTAFGADPQRWTTAVLLP